jgi:hypothetical protein
MFHPFCIASTSLSALSKPAPNTEGLSGSFGLPSGSAVFPTYAVKFLWLMDCSERAIDATPARWGVAIEVPLSPSYPLFGMDE